MVSVYLIDGAAETALGALDADLFAALLAGKSRSGKIRRFAAHDIAVDNAACIEFAADEQREGENLTQALMRRVLPRFVGLPGIDTIIWAGVKGNAEFITAGAWTSNPPSNFPYLPRHYSRWLAERLGCESAELIEVGAACASSTMGIALAADRIVSGKSQAVLVAAADIVTRFSLTGFNSLLALSGSRCRPFDADRDGLLLGDGAAVALLGSEEYVNRLGIAPMARLTGWGAANDATHITAPARDGRGLTAAINAAIRRANIQPGQIDAFCAHGTGTLYNDAMELTALENVFGDRQFPVFSIKGAIGHTLGAAGSIEALVCARALEQGVVPPTSGLRRAEPKAHGRVSAETQTFKNQRILTANSGFGGVNAALILEHIKHG